AARLPPFCCPAFPVSVHGRARLARPPAPEGGSSPVVGTPTRPSDRSSQPSARRAPAVLVILVSKDGAGWLRECLRALSAQTYPRLGVIAVDNGSTDGSLELLHRSLGHERVLSRPENPGLPAAVQAALSIP